MKFGLMFFAASEDSLGADKYRLVIESATFGDHAGFSSVWVPERHFTVFGGLYPNPAVLHAGLATRTQRIRLCAGSVVAPIHHPVRIAEEWSVVDNLSNGRVGLSFASGWNPDDFVFAPDRYADRNTHLIDTMRTVQQLWRGDAFDGVSGVGRPARVKIFPRPVQPELPVWLTVAGNPRNFERAGACGANLLTHLLDQDEAGLAERIALYRRAREAAGFDPATGIVSLMIHTLVGTDAAVVREQARGPYCNYIKANIGLFKGLEQSRGRDVDLSAMSPQDLDEFVNFLYERFAASRGLIGTPESCAPLVARLEAIGVSELACLLDFGPDTDLVLANLPNLARLRDLHEATASAMTPAGGAAGFDRDGVRARCVEPLSGDEFAGLLRRTGIRIDGAFQPETMIWRRDGEALARLHLPAGDPTYFAHPAALDACGRILAAAFPNLAANRDASLMPVGIDACELVAPLEGEVWVHAVLTMTGGASTELTSAAGDVRVFDAAGRPLATLTGLRFGDVDQRPAIVDIAPLMYARTWRPTADDATAPATRPVIEDDASGRWLVVAPAHVGDGALASDVRRRLEALGGTMARAVEPDLRGVVFVAADSTRVPASSDASADVPDALAARDALTAPDAAAQVFRDALALAQSCTDAPLWIVTRGAVAVSDADPAVRVAEAPLWGFGRAMAVDEPGRLGGLIDLDPAGTSDTADDDAALIARTMTGNRREDMVAVRGATTYVPRLTRRGPAKTPTPSLRLDDGDTVLITGGTGGLGLRLVEWLMAHGARHFLLCARRTPSVAAGQHIDRLRATGADIEILQVDVADAAALTIALDRASTARPPVTVVMHLAGVLDDGPLQEQTWERCAAVFAPKVAGAWNLHQAFAGAALKHFVMFSSVSALMPAPGQSSYAAANAFLDALAHHRHALGWPALTMNWGPWSEAGHAETEYGRRAHARLAALGVGSIRPDMGFRVLERAMMAVDAHPQTVAVAVDWTTLGRVDPAAARLSLLADLVSAPPATPVPSTQIPGVTNDGPAAAAPGTAVLRDALVALPRDERRPYLLRYLSDMVVAALRLRTDEPIDARQRLFDIGLDSIVALEMKDRLARALNAPLSATLLFVHPTLDALCEYILAELVPAATDETASPDGQSLEDELTRRLLREIEISRGT